MYVGLPRQACRDKWDSRHSYFSLSSSSTKLLPAALCTMRQFFHRITHHMRPTWMRTEMFYTNDMCQASHAVQWHHPEARHALLLPHPRPPHASPSLLLLSVPRLQLGDALRPPYHHRGQFTRTTKLSGSHGQRPACISIVPAPRLLIQAPPRPTSIGHICPRLAPLSRPRQWLIKGKAGSPHGPREGVVSRVGTSRHHSCLWSIRSACPIHWRGPLSCMTTGRRVRRR
jgi:hypothetical protein